MNKKLNSRFSTLAMILLLVSLLSACATTQTQEAPPEPEKEVVKTVEFEPWEGDPMDIPLDGSSVEAFETSMARIEAYATPEQYEGLKSLLDYLLTYDIGAQGDYATLTSRLDGQTPKELWKRFNWRRGRPGTSPVEADAADAKIIDGK